MESSIDKQMAQAIVKDSWRKQRAFTESYLLDKVENQAAAIEAVSQVIARMKSNLGSHATYIKELEEAIGTLEIVVNL